MHQFIFPLVGGLLTGDRFYSRVLVCAYFCHDTHGNYTQSIAFSNTLGLQVQQATMFWVCSAVALASV
jgi:hypothetical protein